MEERCRARCVLVDGIVKTLTGGPHNHSPHTEKITKILKRNERNESNEVRDEAKVEYWMMDSLTDSSIQVFEDDIMDGV